VKSLWLDRPPIDVDEQPEESYDDVVVGAGLTGLTTGLLLARAGHRVLVVEARQVGAVTTGHTTGKLSLLQGTTYSTLLKRQSRRVVEAYVEANREGQAWLLAFCAEHGVPVQHRPSATYAADMGTGRRQARAEHEAAASLGLAVRWVDDLAVPFPQFGATLLDDQAQFDSMDVLAALTAELRAQGGCVVEQTRLVDVTHGADPQVTLDDGSTVRAERVVLATGTPVLDRGLYFAKVEPKRSYALAYDHPDPLELMLLAAGTPSRSLRDARSGGGRQLIVGGEGHPVGRTRSEALHLDRLREWTADYFPGAVETHTWSAQDYTSHDQIPFVGLLPRGGGSIYLATGYNKWGMTNAVAASLNLLGQILGSQPAWGRRMRRRITRPRAAADIVRMNAAVGVAMAVGYAGVALHPASDEPPAEGTGTVERRGATPVARATVAGRTCAVSAVCTHLGGVLRFNDAEQSWDCPLHGSRFAVTGEVLEGPAVRPLPSLD